MKLALFSLFVASASLVSEASLRGNTDQHRLAMEGDQLGPTVVNVTSCDYPSDGEEKEDDVHVLPVAVLNGTTSNSSDLDGHERKLQAATSCGIFADGYYFHPPVGSCYSLGGTWWNDRVTWVRSGSGTRLQTWDDSPAGGNSIVFLGDNWASLYGSSPDLYKKISHVCCTTG